jgi:hypothetical protein
MNKLLCLLSIGPSLAEHLGNNSEQPGSLLEVEPMTLSADLQVLPAHALLQTIARPHATQTAPPLKYSPLQLHRLTISPSRPLWIFVLAVSSARSNYRCSEQPQSLASPYFFPAIHKQLHLTAGPFTSITDRCRPAVHTRHWPPALHLHSSLQHSTPLPRAPPASGHS